MIENETCFRIIPELSSPKEAENVSFVRVPISLADEDGETVGKEVPSSSSSCCIENGKSKNENFILPEAATSRFQFVRDWRSLEGNSIQLADYFLVKIVSN